MSEKTLDAEKIREAIETLKEAREVLGEIEEVLPKDNRDNPIRFIPWYPHPYTYQVEPRWQIWESYTDSTTYAGATNSTVYN